MKRIVRGVGTTRAVPLRNPVLGDNPALVRLFSLREIAEKTGLSARSLQFWVEQGVILCDAPDARTGRGVHRYFHPIEVQVASLLVPLTAGELPVGVLRKLSIVFRAALKAEPLDNDAMPGGLAVADWHEFSRVLFRSVRGEGRNYLAIPYSTAKPSAITTITDEVEKPIVDLAAVYPPNLARGAGFLMVIEITERLARLFA
jgi:hypothetical protein